MFVKLSFESFTYDFTETFFFPGKETKEIYDKYMIEMIFPLFNTDRYGQYLCIFHFHLQTRK